MDGVRLVLRNEIKELKIGTVFLYLAADNDIAFIAVKTNKKECAMLVEKNGKVRAVEHNYNTWSTNRMYGVITSSRTKRNYASIVNQAKKDYSNLFSEVIV